MEEYQMVRDESREADEEVAELRRLLAEAEARREIVITGQGNLTWWGVIYSQLVWMLWGRVVPPPPAPRCDGDDESWYELRLSSAGLPELHL